MSYQIEYKICSKNGWSTPAEARNIWSTPYDREGVTAHWWGDGTGAWNHDNIVNYFLGQAAAGNKSVNYVVSDDKITCMVSPDNVAWCSTAGNPTTISIEHQPTLGDEGYKKSGWLISELAKRYNRDLTMYRHDHWNATTCCGTIDINRLGAEADKWYSGGYDTPPPPVNTPKPVPPVVIPPAPSIKIVYSKEPMPVRYVLNKDANLWDFNTATWAGFTSVKQLKKGDEFFVYGWADNTNVHAKYGMTQFSFGAADSLGSPAHTWGVNMADLDLAQAPVVVPPPAQVDPPVPPVVPPTPEPPVIVTPPTPPVVTPPVVPPVEPEYPGWFVGFWVKLWDAIKGILNIK